VETKTLTAVTLPGNVVCAPDYVLSMIKCGCSVHVPESAVAKMLICHAQCSVLAIPQVVLEMVMTGHRSGVVSISH